MANIKAGNGTIDEHISLFLLMDAHRMSLISALILEVKDTRNYNRHHSLFPIFTLLMWRLIISYVSFTSLSLV